MSLLLKGLVFEFCEVACVFEDLDKTILVKHLVNFLDLTNVLDSLLYKVLLSCIHGNSGQCSFRHSSSLLFVYWLILDGDRLHELCFVDLNALIGSEKVERESSLRFPLDLHIERS